MAESRTVAQRAPRYKKKKKYVCIQYNETKTIKKYVFAPPINCAIERKEQCYKNSEVEIR